MKTSPVRGMCDRGISETFLRNEVLGKILDFYQRSGFFRIETPAVEDAENISRSEGGSNLNLIFEIMKRGDKLQKAIESGQMLSDMALRYDLTLPLSRFYSANASNLPMPFKVIQTGRVYRAERPQKGRLREFVQCDIDIIGDESPDCEIELFLTSLNALHLLGFENLTLVINDKRILKHMFLSFGFDESDFETVCISLDKQDKIGIDGVASELMEKSASLRTGNAQESIGKLISWLGSEESGDLNCEATSQVSSQLRYVIEKLSALLPKGYGVSYSPVLVRGQSYYTGIVAEVVSQEFSSSIAGGGRYDGMIGKFLGRQVGAVGISIGFERIMSILAEKGMRISGASRLALFYNSDDDFGSVLKMKSALQGEGYYVHVFRDVKSRKKLFDSVAEYGFDCYCDFKSGKVVGLKSST